MNRTLRRCLKSGAGGLLLLAGLAVLAVASARADTYHEGGIVRRPRPAAQDAQPARFDRHPPMSFAVPYLPSPTPEGPVPVVRIPVQTRVLQAAYSIPDADAGRAAATRVSPLPSEVHAALPWNQVGFEGYDEPPGVAMNTPLASPSKYSLTATTVDHKGAATNPNIAVLLAHLPEHAALWIEGRLTSTKGNTRHFESPPLLPGKKYTYTVCAVWNEGGRPVTQTVEVSVRAGQVHGLYLTLTPEAYARKKAALVDLNLAALSPDDQKVARLQATCVVKSDTRLGEMGVPVKILVKGRRVFFCNAECARQALTNPDETWAKALELRTKNAAKDSGK